MSARAHIQKTLILVAMAVFLTATTGILSGPPLKALRVKLGRGPFVLTFAGLTTLFLGLGWTIGAITFFVMSFFIAVFVEFDERGEELFYSGLYATLFSMVLVTIGFGVWMAKTGSEWVGHLTSGAQAIIDQYTGAGIIAEATISARDLLVQAPSAVVIVLLISLLLALVFENGIHLWAGLPLIKRRGLKDFRLPEATIWVLIGSMAAAYVKHDIKWLQAVSVNLFHICLLIYFFFRLKFD